MRLKNRILRIGIVGAPQSGKTSLIEYLRNYLKKDYQVIIAEEPPTVLLKAGLNPPHNISGLDFQKECLDEYCNVYNRIDKYMGVFKEIDKPIIILYDTLPEIGQCYLKGKNNEGISEWQDKYNSVSAIFKDHTPDKIYVLEMLQGEFSTKGNAVRRELEVQKVLSVEEKILQIFEGATFISNNYSIEERAGEINEYIEDYFTPTTTTQSFNISSVTCTQSCSRCGWCDNIDYFNLYKYCPMCGLPLYPVKDPTRTDGGGLDPLGEEARRKMFYVDPTKLPTYSSTTTYTTSKY